MTLRICESLLRRSLRFSRLVIPLQSAPALLGTAPHVCAVRTTVFRFVPACFLSNEGFADSQMKERAVATEESHAGSLGSTAVLPDKAEHLSLMLKNPDQPENSKVLRVAIIGAPNAGKSTLTNQLLGRKLFAASHKVHTTRSRALGVITEDDTQIILLDTPGLITPAKAKRHQLEKSFLLDPMRSFREADLVVVLVDVSDKWTHNKLDFEVLKCLAMNPNIPAVLVLNKVDLLRNKTMLLDITADLTEGTVNGQRLIVRNVVKQSYREAAERQTEQTAGLEAQNNEKDCLELKEQIQKGLSREQLRTLKKRKGWPHFKDVFMMCATDGEDVQTLKMYLKVGAKQGPWQYHSAVLTDQSPDNVCSNAIREKLLEYLPQEVPYTITQHIELWRETTDGKLDISVKLHVKKDSHMKMVIGPGGQLIARIAQEAGLDLTNAFMCEAHASQLQSGSNGVNPKVKYVLVMDMVPFDDNKYKWSRDHWEVSGPSEPHLPNHFFIHPDSHAMGERWMQCPISFHKLKLTNNTLNLKGLYQPRLHIVQAPVPCGGHSGGYLRFTFPEAAFIPVTTYQNHEITKLKINNHPFAKGFRDTGLNRKRFKEKAKLQRSASPQQQYRTQSQQAARPLDTDDEADEMV